MTGPAFLIERDPKESGRQIGIASPLPRVGRYTPMLLQGNDAPLGMECRFKPAGGGTDHRRIVPGFDPALHHRAFGAMSIR
jgi:hypothetical protein